MSDIVYAPEQIESKLREAGLTDWYLEDGWLRRKFTTDGWPTTLMLCNAIEYLPGRFSSRRPGHHLGQALGEAQDALRGRHHRQGLHARENDRRSRPLAPATGGAGRDAQQVRASRQRAARCVTLRTMRNDTNQNRKLNCARPSTLKIRGPVTGVTTPSVSVEFLPRPT